MVAISPLCKTLLLRPNKRFDCVFFDFDGTVADTANAKKDIFFKITPPELHGHVRKILDSHAGLTRQDIFYQITETSDCLNVEELVAQFSTETLRIYERCEIFTDFNTLKQYFEVPFFILSSAPRDEVMSVLTRHSIDTYFEEVFHTSNKKQFFENYYRKNKGPIGFFGDGIQDKNCETLQFIEFIYCEDWADGSIEELSVHTIGNLSDVIKLWRNYYMGIG